MFLMSYTDLYLNWLMWKYSFPNIKDHIWSYMYFQALRGEGKIMVWSRYVQDWMLVRFKFLNINIIRYPHWQLMPPKHTQIWKWRVIIAVNFPIWAIGKKKPEKKSGLQRDSNLWPPQYRSDALPTELWSHTLVPAPAPHTPTQTPTPTPTAAAITITITIIISIIIIFNEGALEPNSPQRFSVGPSWDPSYWIVQCVHYLNQN